MRLALLSDIHANVEALTAALATAEREGVTEYAFLGDLVGYGAEPERVLDIVSEYAARGATVIRGNHDQAALVAPTSFSEAAEASASWTRARLTAPYKAFLATLPISQTLGDVLLVHASAHTPELWPYIEDERAAAQSLAATTAAYTFVGHVHHQTLYFQGADRTVQRFKPSSALGIPLSSGRRWLATIGSVGQPRDGDPRAGFAIFDRTSHRLAFHRVAYDWQSAAAKIRAAGLDPWLAERLEYGR